MSRIAVAFILTTILMFMSVASLLADELIPLDAVGRLIIDGEKMCTAFVVRSTERESVGGRDGPERYYENWLVSAGHCYSPSLTYHPQSGGWHPVIAVAFSATSGGYDLLVGRFNTPRPVATLELAPDVIPAVGDSVLMIGYGRRALMTRVGRIQEYDERGYMMVNNYASMGNSGGPVLIPWTRMVVGVATETTIDRPKGATPMYCMMARCGVKPPYVAVPISRLLGLARWPR